MPNQQQRSVLITGCSTGIGRCIALGLRDRGYRVFASVRNPKDIDDLTVMTDGRGSFVVTVFRSKTGLSEKTGYLIQTDEGKPQIVNQFF